MDMESHVPSPVLIAGHSALITFEGQPVTCYICNAPGPFIANLPSENTKIHATYFELQTYAGTVD
jgi:hypothetical protein